MFLSSIRRSVFFRFKVIALVCLSLAGDAYPAVESLQSSDSGTLSVQSRFKPFAEKHKIDFADVMSAVMAAGELRKIALDENVRAGQVYSNVLALNKRLSGIEIRKPVGAEHYLQPDRLSSGTTYAYTTIYFKNRASSINVLFFKSSAAINDYDLRELGIEDAERHHLDCPGMEGVWFVHPDSRRPISLQVSEPSVKSVVRKPVSIMPDEVLRSIEEIESDVVRTGEAGSGESLITIGAEPTILREKRGAAYLKPLVVFIGAATLASFAFPVMADFMCDILEYVVSISVSGIFVMGGLDGRQDVFNPEEINSSSREEAYIANIGAAVKYKLQRAGIIDDAKLLDICRTNGEATAPEELRKYFNGMRGGLISRLMNRKEKGLAIFTLVDRYSEGRASVKIMAGDVNDIELHLVENGTSLSVDKRILFELDAVFTEKDIRLTHLVVGGELEGKDADKQLLEAFNETLIRSGFSGFPISMSAMYFRDMEWFANYYNGDGDWDRTGVGVGLNGSKRWTLTLRELDMLPGLDEKLANLEGDVRFKLSLEDYICGNAKELISSEMEKEVRPEQLGEATLLRYLIYRFKRYAALRVEIDKLTNFLNNDMHKLTVAASAPDKERADERLRNLKNGLQERLEHLVKRELDIFSNLRTNNTYITRYELYSSDSHLWDTRPLKDKVGELRHILKEMADICGVQELNFKYDPNDKEDVASMLKHASNRYVNGTDRLSIIGRIPTVEEYKNIMARKATGQTPIPSRRQKQAGPDGKSPGPAKADTGLFEAALNIIELINSSALFNRIWFTGLSVKTYFAEPSQSTLLSQRWTQSATATAADRRFIDYLWGRILTVDDEKKMSEAEAFRLLVRLMNRDFSLGLSIDECIDLERAELRQEVLERIFSNGNELRPRPDVYIKPYIILLGYVSIRPEKFMRGVYDATISKRPEDRISMVGKYSISEPVDAAVHYHDREILFRGADNIFRPELGYSQWDDETGVKLSDDVNTTYKVNKALSVIGLKSKAPGAETIKKVWDEIYPTLTIVQLNGARTVYADPDDMLIRPFHNGRRRHAIYLPQNFLSEFKINDTGDVNELAEYIYYAMHWFYVYEHEKGQATRSRLNEESECLTKNDGQLALVEAKDIRSRFHYLMEEATVEMCQSIFDKANRYGSYERWLRDVKEKIRSQKHANAEDLRYLDEMRRAYLKYAYTCELLGAVKVAMKYYVMSHESARLIQRYKSDDNELPIKLEERLMIFYLKRGLFKKFLEELNTMLTGDGYPEIIPSPNSKFKDAAEARSDLLLNMYLYADSRIACAQFKREIDYVLEYYSNMNPSPEYRLEIERVRSEAMRKIENFRARVEKYKTNYSDEMVRDIEDAKESSDPEKQTALLDRFTGDDKIATTNALVKFFMSVDDKKDPNGNQIRSRYMDVVTIYGFPHIKGLVTRRKELIRKLILANIHPPGTGNVNRDIEARRVMTYHVSNDPDKNNSQYAIETVIEGIARDAGGKSHQAFYPLIVGFARMAGFENNIVEIMVNAYRNKIVYCDSRDCPNFLETTKGIVKALAGDESLPLFRSKFLQEVIFAACENEDAMPLLEELLGEYGVEPSLIRPGKSLYIKDLSASAPETAKDRSESLYPEDTVTPASQSAERIHAANLDMVTPIAEKKVLCHMIAGSILPSGQRNMLNELESKMRNDESYREKIINVAIPDGSNFIDELKARMAEAEKLYEGCDVEFDVACPDIELIKNIQNSIPGVKALAFGEVKDIEADAVQVEGIILALRALRSDNIDSLKMIYELLAGKKLSPEFMGIADISEFASRVVFTLPASKIEDNLNRKKLNDLIKANILNAA